MTKIKKELAIYQAKDGSIELNLDNKNETIWATRMQMAEVFGVNPQAISKHLNNIYKEGELKKEATSSKMELVQNESGRTVRRKIEFYNLDAIISIGYRINSKQATQFRIWATKTLKQHITKGYTINPKIITKHYQEFLNAVDDVKVLAQNNKNISSDDILELIKSFSSTWFTLESYDKQKFPKQEKNANSLRFSSDEIYKEIAKLKNHNV